MILWFKTTKPVHHTPENAGLDIWHFTYTLQADAHFYHLQAAASFMEVDVRAFCGSTSLSAWCHSCRARGCPGVCLGFPGCSFWSHQFLCHNTYRKSLHMASGRFSCTPACSNWIHFLNISTALVIFVVRRWGRYLFHSHCDPKICQQLPCQCDQHFLFLYKQLYPILKYVFLRVQLSSMQR